MAMRPSTLIDLGEDSILAENVFEMLGHQAAAPGSEIIVGLGDDAAVIAIDDGAECLVLTTDPCPTPALCMVDGCARDLWHYGWMTVVINLSDLAAMGASPIALVVSTVMPERLKKEEYDRFLEGMREAGKRWDCPILGGNIKDGPSFTATGAALGRVPRANVLRRDGAQPGDCVVVIGEMGLFWAALLHYRHPSTSLSPDDCARVEAALQRPEPRIREGRAAARSEAVTACIDSSDGIGVCLAEIARCSSLTRAASGQTGVGMVLDLERLQPSPSVEAMANASGIAPSLLMLSWGGWELVCTVNPLKYDRFIDAVREQAPDTVVTCVGTVIESSDEVQIQHSGERLSCPESGKPLTLSAIGSRRFSSTSIFSHGLEPFIKRLRDESDQLIRSMPSV